MDATPPSSSREDCAHAIETMLPMRDGVRLHTFAAWPRVARNAVLPAASFLSIPTRTPVSQVEALTL